MGPFWITIELAGRKYRLKAERTNLFPLTERWQITAKNRMIVLENNRPQLQKKALDQYEWQWRLVAGKCPADFFMAITREIRNVLDWMNKH